MASTIQLTDTQLPLYSHLADSNRISYFAVAEEAIVHAKYGDVEHIIAVPEGKSVTVETIIDTLDLGKFVEVFDVWS